MTFSAKTEYGLVALIELAAVDPPGSTLQAGEICRRQGIPARYLDQMLTSLRKGGLLRSIRGPRGGYQLARPPAAISVAEVIACLERDIAAERQGDRSTLEFGVVAGLETRLEQARTRLLQATTLQHLLEERAVRAQPQQMFYI
ncbi:MAG: Rrf2 family transcriptional regulator [Cyanobium sp. PLM2.Bin73]|nr:MAG: Rrf2 family transcriptional regulator [Cyanobium sp. PLM2.Bin73]